MIKKLYKITVLILAAAMLAATLTGCAPKPDAAIPVTTAAAQQRPLDAELSVAGVLLPARTVSVSGKLSGLIVSMSADVGKSVKKDETLITLETKQLNAQLAQAQAALEAAKANVVTAKSTASSASYASKVVQGQASLAKINLDAAQAAYDSIKAAFDAGLATQAQLDEASVKLQVAKTQYNTASGPSVSQAKDSANSASNAVAAANAAVVVAEANVNLIQVQIDNAVIKSPMDGVVLNRNINEGELAAPSVPLVILADVTTLKLKGTVSQKALAILTQGQSVNVLVDIYPGRTFSGQISLLGPMAVTTGEYFPIEISIQNSEGLKPGLTAHASMQVKSEQNLVVPVSAVIRENDKSFVFVAENGKAVKRAVTTGLGNTNDIEILNGLKAGEQVISSNAGILTDGASVRVQEK